MKTLATMPNYLGAALYPENKPMKAERWKHNGKTLREIITTKPKTDEEKETQKQIYRDYLLYSLAAPCHKIKTEELKALEKASISEIEKFCSKRDINPLESD